MTQLLYITLSDTGLVMLILGIIAVLMAFAAFIIWNDLFHNSKKK